MNLTASRSVPDGRDDASRKGATTALVLLLPVALGALLWTGASHRAAGCLTYGTDCSPVRAVWVLWAFLASAGCGVLARVWPRHRLPFPTWRSCLVTVQVAAQLAMAGMILSFA